jgi:hypothetical protein
MGTKERYWSVSNSVVGPASARGPPPCACRASGSVLPALKQVTHKKGAVEAPTSTAPGHRILCRSSP